MHSIYASQSGSIPLINTLVLQKGSHLRIILNSKLVFSYQPILITSIKQPPRSPRSFSPTRPQKNYRKVLRGDLQKQCPFQFHWVYDVVQHTIGKEGSFIFDLKCKQIGHHFVRIIWLNWDDQIVEQMGDPLHFLIQNEIMLNLRTLTIQTILPNLINKWDFEGYDAYHLCPIQEVSKSLYSITDQLSLRGFKNIEELGDFIRNSKKIFFVDIVLNHTSPDSKWLDLEECVYNERTVPQLKSALELDISLEQVTCYEDIEIIVRKLNLEEYFELQEQLIGPIFLEDDDDDNIFDDIPLDKCVQILQQRVINLGVKRKGAMIKNLEEVCNKFSKETIEQGIIVLNNKLRSQCQNYIEEAIINIQNYYKRENNIQRYFYKLNNYYAAYNGWIMDINPEEDFVTSSNFHYLRRSINHWHVIKLRYAKDTPLLYQRMTQYIQQMASVFHGIRLDNAHTTKFHDLSYFIRKARKINPELVIFGEFFGLNQQQYLHYQSYLGINAFVKELIYSNNTKEIAEILRNPKILPQFNPIQYLVYDQSHDNESIIKKYGPHHLVTLVTALQFSDNFKGTNRMVDQFYDQHISCVFENRKYPQQYLQIITLQKRLIRFTYNTSKYNVILRGSFDDWEKDHPMKLITKDLYEIYIELDIGEHQYKYIVDGVWQCDINQPIFNDNNLIQIQPIQCYQSLTFIRNINLQQYSRTYIHHETNYLIITKTNEDHLQSEIIVICFNHVFETIQMPSNILQLQQTYSYLQYSQTIQIENQLPNNLHLIDTTTIYATFIENQLKVNAPPSTVFILKLNTNHIVQLIQEFLNSQLEYDISLLYRFNKQYEIPNCGLLEPSGLYGVYKYIKQIETNDHPFIQHILHEDTLIQHYISQFPEIEDILILITKLPTNYKPFFFIKVITRIVESIENKYTKIQEPFLRQLDILSKSFDLDNCKKGRELFMSLKGLVLLTGRFEQAKYQIIKYAHYLKEGLIPNTLRPLRYNTRDTCFWWIKAIRDYILVSDDYELFTGLQDKIFSIFQCHANGINIKEGYQNDFTDKDGLQIQLYMDSETGMILGGNYKNCLTWMDTIGSSKINCGFPAASRDGAPVECTALLKLCLDFVHKMYQLQKFKFEGIKYMNRTITWKAWSDYLCQHFERCYWVPTDQTQFIKYSIQLKHLRRKGIYKDIYNCSKPRSEYQLRPNACIAIALAPELFQKQHAAHYLAKLEQYLISNQSIGVSTLDSIASEFSGKLIQEENDDFAKSKGFSLYNGSEFVFLLGYYLKALLKIHKTDINKTIFYAYLAQLKQHLLNEFTMPEYTNVNGELIEYQNSMLSVALIQELIYDRQQLDN